MNIVKYWSRLHSLDNTRVLYKAFQEDKMLALRNPRLSWSYSVSHIFKALGLGCLMNSTNRNIFAKGIIEQKLTKQFDDFYEQSISPAFNTNSKLRTYFSYKPKPEYSTYLSYVQNIKHRRGFTFLRLGLHDLEIERGRYKGIDPNLRYCTFCNNGHIEDEKHFLVHCKRFDSLRLNLFVLLISSDQSLGNYNSTEIFLRLINPPSRHASLIAKYVYNCNEMRKNIQATI